MKGSEALMPITKPFLMLEKAQRAVEAMRFLVKKNEALLDHNKKLREEIKKLIKRPRSHA